MNIELCDICNVMYCSDLVEDHAHHYRIHQLLTAGVPMPQSFTHLLLMPTPGDQIAVVTHNHAPLAEKQMAEEVAWAAKQSIDRHAGFNWYRYLAKEPINEALDYHILLYLHEDSAIGLLAVCRRPVAYRVVWDANVPGTTIEGHQWCIQMAWTAHNWRNTGIAKTLVTQATAYLHLSDATAFAWSAPFTTAGAALVKKFCPVEFLIA